MNRETDDSEYSDEVEKRERIRKTKVISGFPGIGKTSLFGKGSEQVFLDSDSTTFSWANEEKTVRNPEWPQNYLAHIRENTGKADAIFVSSHDVVRRALVKAGIPFTLVYPSLEMKEEYIQRYIQRGSNDRFIQLLKENYKKWILELMAQEGCTHVVLQAGQYLSDVIQNIL